MRRFIRDDLLLFTYLLWLPLRELNAMTSLLRQPVWPCGTVRDQDGQLPLLVPMMGSWRMAVQIGAPLLD